MQSADGGNEREAIKHYKTIFTKTIIVEPVQYRRFLRLIFPKLIFKKYDEHHNQNNFYFNIRRELKKQDVFIDYIRNYPKNIPAKNIYLVPWYDMNDPLILFRYRPEEEIKTITFSSHIIKFSSCARGNYNNTGAIWDNYMEQLILSEYSKLFGHPNNTFILSKLNEWVKVSWTNTTQVNNYVIPVQIPIQIPIQPQQPQDNEIKINEMIDVMNSKVSNLIEMLN